jgi:hypothetical protein
VECNGHAVPCRFFRAPERTPMVAAPAKDSKVYYVSCSGMAAHMCSEGCAANLDRINFSKLLPGRNTSIEPVSYGIILLLAELEASSISFVCPYNTHSAGSTCRRQLQLVQVISLGLHS